jgi:hypothetical protein
MLPAPRPDATADADLPDLMELRLRNRTIPVAHVLPLPRVATGADLHDYALDALALPGTVEPLTGIVDTRFRYRFEVAGRPILDGKLVDQNVQDDCLVDLLVTVEVLGRGEIITTWTLRGQPAGAADPRGVRRARRRLFQTPGTVVGHLLDKNMSNPQSRPEIRGLSC